MKKRIYRALDVKKVDFSKLSEAVAGQEVTLGIDVAKEIMYLVVMLPPKEVVLLLKWRHPQETGIVVNGLSQLSASKIVAVLESSSTYGDSLKHQLFQAGIVVNRVGTKRSRDAIEVYDGVPSSHDAKSAIIVARLHLDGSSEPWPIKTETERKMAAALSVMALHDDYFHRNVNRLESQLARYWPELTTYLALTSATILELLAKYGGPQGVARNSQQSRELMQRVGGRFLSPEKIQAVIESAYQTLGVPQIEGEVAALQELASEARRAQCEAHKHKVHVERLSQGEEVISTMINPLGKVTAAVVFTFGGDPTRYPNAASYLKNLGLNLKEKSSGKHKGQLKISKRGSSIVRQYLYLAVLRLIHRDRVFSAWHKRKIARSGGKKMVSIVALMRKLVKGLWHVARGDTFDSALLFDIKRLNIAVT